MSKLVGNESRAGRDRSPSRSEWYNTNFTSNLVIKAHVANDGHMWHYTFLHGFTARWHFSHFQQPRLKERVGEVLHLDVLTGQDIWDLCVYP